MFEKIVILGNGNLAQNIARFLQKRPIVCASYRENALSLFSTWCQKNQIPYHNFHHQKDVKCFLESFQQQTLIISANNYYLFPDEIIRQERFKIINYHNSLLPHHRGLNAQMWSIFEQDSTSGITWHCVVPCIDCGAVIIQKSIALDSSETYLTLTQKQLKLAFEAFMQICPRLLEWNLTTSQQENGDFVLHKRTDLPNGGYLDLQWDWEKKSAFLRSMDCGKSGALPKPHVILNGKEYAILGYKENRENALGFDLNLGEKNG
ncbi:MAG: hypothetical protein K2N12_09645 [Helicobacter sp.]|nr:hypothetical protein [Helicobacter sp.]